MESRRRRHEQAAAKAGSAGGHGGCSRIHGRADLAGNARHAGRRRAGLPAGDRRAVLLRYFEDRGIADIAAELNVNEGAAKQRLSRAVEKLRQRITGRSGALARRDRRNGDGGAARVAQLALPRQDW